MSSSSSSTTTGGTKTSNNKKRYPILRLVVKHILQVLLRPSGGWYTSFINTLRHIFWTFLYNVMSKLSHHDTEWQFINYGYIPDDGKLTIQLLGEDIATSAKEKCGESCIQLYHEVVTAVPIQDTNIIEIGCGRGGGASYITRYLHPTTMTGIDYCTTSIEFANIHHKTKCPKNNLHFQQGNAVDLVGIPSNAYDVVVNVESSHCYPNFLQFMKEAYRILKPDGYVVLCDMRVAQHVPAMEQDMITAGFIIKQNVDITSNVLISMQRCSTTREQLMQDKFGTKWYKIIRIFFSNFAGLEGSFMYESFLTRHVVYKRYVLHKPTKSE